MFAATPIQARRNAQVNGLGDRLLRGASTTGGWPYSVGQSARLEPTAWAILALSSLPQTSRIRAAIEAALGWLGRIQGATGLLVEPGIPKDNYGWNGLVLMALLSLQGSSTQLVQRLTTGLLGVKGRSFEGNRDVIGQDNSLQAWSWVENTFSWIEPTSYCLLALKKQGSLTAVASSRVAEAEAVLFDRVCEEGGWNYGNATVLGQDLRPYVPTTALALLALQDKRSHPSVVRSIAWLERHQSAERSAMALSLAVVCLGVLGRPTHQIIAALEQQRTRTAFLDNLHLEAMALYAANFTSHGGRAFTFGNVPAA